MRPCPNCLVFALSLSLAPETPAQTRTQPPHGHRLMTDSVCQATFKGWMDIMYAAVDSRKVRTSLAKPQPS